MNKKRFLVVSISLAGGGAERVASLLLQHLDRQRFEPSLVVFENRFDYPLPVDVKVTCFYKKGAWELPRLIWRLAQVYDKEKPDVVLSFMNYANLIALLARKLSHNKPRLLISEHDCVSVSHRDESKLFSYPKTWAIPRLYPEADAVVCVSRGVADDLVTHLKVPRQKIKVIYNPVDIGYVSSLAEEEVDHPYFTTGETPVIIAVGRLTPQKGYPYLLKAFAQVAAKLLCRLVILGEGEEGQTLKKLVRQLRIEKQVSFLGFRKNPFKYLAHSDIFVLSSLWEGFSLAILEAMTCGIPVISSRCPPGPDEIITDGMNGLLVPVADETALAEAMLRLLNDKSLSAKLAQAGRQRAEDFTLATIIKEYEALL
jgi:glycosyltransferase involved in cell wall biosynthesis